MLRAHQHWLPVLLWMGVIFTMSTSLGSAEHTSRLIEPIVRWLKPDISTEGMALAHFVVRKGGHLTEYAILALLVHRALKKSRPAGETKGHLKMAGIALLISAAYAATDEYHQSFVPGRTPSPYDVLIDASGAFLALTAVSVVRKSRGTDGKL